MPQYRGYGQLIFSIDKNVQVMAFIRDPISKACKA